MTPSFFRSSPASAAARLGREREQQMLGARELVLEPFGFLLGVRKTVRTRARETRLRAALHARQLVDEPLHGTRQARGIDVHLAEHGRDDAVWLFDEREQQMLRQHLRMARALGELLCGQDGLLRLLGVAIQIHCRRRPASLSAS